MRVVVFRSACPEAEPPGDGAYSQTFDTRYADRVIGNLANEDDFCTSCQAQCVHCRRPYARSFAGHVAGVIPLPSPMPYVLERPAEHVPADVPPHDVLIAISIHEQILIESIKRSGEWGTRGVVVPIEAPDWISGAARAQAERLCQERGIEIAFPKPFCDFAPPAGSFLDEFRRAFHIGFPEVVLTVRDGVIEKADVKVSAPCGATYYIARWLEGKRVDDDLRHDVISRRLHSYPCTSSMEWDDDLGDTILHVAGQNHYAILDQLGAAAERDEAPLVMSPLGIALPKPVPVTENVRNVEQAKEAILRRLAARETVPLSELRQGDETPAAINTALVILKRDGRIRVEGNRVRRT